MTEEIKSKEYFYLVPIALGHLFFGAGIILIGQKTKNKKEILGGILFILLYLGLFIYSSVLPCYQSIFGPIGEQCSLKGTLNLLLWVFGIGSWIYIIIRLRSNWDRVKLI